MLLKRLDVVYTLEPLLIHLIFKLFLVDFKRVELMREQQYFILMLLILQLEQVGQKVVGLILGLSLLLTLEMHLMV